MPSTVWSKIIPNPEFHTRPDDQSNVRVEHTHSRTRTFSKINPSHVLSQEAISGCGLANKRSTVGRLELQEARVPAQERGRNFQGEEEDEVITKTAAQYT